MTFNEITKRAVQEAFRIRAKSTATWSTRSRRVAYSTAWSGTRSRRLLWDKVRRGLSAGRVQTVALRLIVEREREIKVFVKEEYWTIDAHLPGRSRRRSTRASSALVTRRRRSH